MISLDKVSQDPTKLGLKGRPATEEPSDHFKQVHQSIQSTNNSTTILQQLQEAIDTSSASPGSAGFVNTIVGAVAAMTNTFDFIEKSKSQKVDALGKQLEFQNVLASLQDELTIVSQILGTITNTNQNKDEATAGNQIKTDVSHKSDRRDDDDKGPSVGQGFNSLLSTIVNALQKVFDPDFKSNATNSSSSGTTTPDATGTTDAPAPPSPVDAFKQALANMIKQATNEGNLEAELKEKEKAIETALQQERQVAELKAKATDLTLEIKNASENQNESKSLTLIADDDTVFAESQLSQIIEDLIERDEPTPVNEKKPHFLAQQYAYNASQAA